MHSFIVVLAVLATAFAVSAFDSPFGFNRDKSDLEYSDKDCKCKNGRCVTDNRGKTKCACKSGYALQDDETCEICDCGSNGKCFFSLQIEADGNLEYEKKCLCDKGYAPKDGSCVECVCGENSKCEFDDGVKNCYCIDGYSERNGVCTKCNCGVFGECKFVNGDKQCTCDENYLVNNGICEECNCGAYGTCSFQNGIKACSCLEGYKVKQGTCEKCDCGILGLGCRYEEKKKVCECKSTDAQRYGTCEECGCGEHSSGCTFDGDVKHCKCENGYVQKGTVCEVGCGVYRQCENGGECNSGFCTCLKGTSGEFCEVIDECHELCPNQRDSICSYDLSRQKAYCRCQDETLNYDTATAQCKRSCSDDNWRCENGGNCVQTGDHAFCRCLDRTSGDMCEIVDDCAQGILSCGNDSECVYDVPKKKASCACIDPAKSYNSLLKLCKDTCDKTKKCNNGGECAQFDDYEFCKCPPGTSGDLCEVVDECVSNEQKCKDNAVCYFDETAGRAACLCKDPQKKYDVRRERCIATCNEERNCKNGGLCPTDGSDFCNCREGTSGDLCEIVNDCQKGLCGFDKSVKCSYDIQKKAGVCGCWDGLSKYDPYTKTCKGCDCGPNSLDCRYVGQRKACQCKDGFAQRYGVCLECNCGPHSIGCRFDDDVQYCTCKNGYVQRELTCVGSCNQIQCKNGGTCVSGYCKCLSGTSGAFCEIVNDCQRRGFCIPGTVCYFDVWLGRATCSCGHPAFGYDETDRTCKRCNCGNYSYGCLFLQHRKYCACVAGFAQRYGVCLACNCGPHSTGCRFDDDVQYCKCKPGYVQRGLVCVGGCNQCRNGGTCESGYCRCLPGTSGASCEFVTDCQRSGFCRPGEWCYFDIWLRKAACARSGTALAYDEIDGTYKTQHK